VDFNKNKQEKKEEKNIKERWIKIKNYHRKEFKLSLSSFIKIDKRYPISLLFSILAKTLVYPS